jgi:hypothetical protein
MVIKLGFKIESFLLHLFVAMPKVLAFNFSFFNLGSEFFNSIFVLQILLSLISEKLAFPFS